MRSVDDQPRLHGSRLAANINATGLSNHNKHKSHISNTGRLAPDQYVFGITYFSVMAGEN